MTAPHFRFDARSALLVIDVQRDFCAGGTLAVPACEAIVPVINEYLADANGFGVPVYASRDWHPPMTRHFMAYGGPWPPHCVQGSEGARFHPGLNLPRSVVVINKGEMADEQGYSAFDGHTSNGRPLLTDLQVHGIDALYVAGLATDYCVRQTTLDARRFGFRVSVLTDAIAGIDIHAGDVDRAIDEMAHAGAQWVNRKESVLCQSHG